MERSHMPDKTKTPTMQDPQPIELPPDVLNHVAAGVSSVEFGEAVAAFVLSHMF
jgi:hypothetical protein